jgi:SAM-dependent methyltransferase
MYTIEDWNKRAKRHGHTGHSEPFYYCFDQQARLYAITNVLRNLDSGRSAALDFGCGSGDFIELLDNYYDTIYGYDISDVVLQKAQKKVRNPTITLSNKLDPPAGTKFDLILTVTVLATLPPQELDKILGSLSQFLADKGSMVAMEFFASEEHNHKHGTNSTTNHDWHEALKKNNLKIVSTYNFYNPVELPSKSWLAYKNDLVIRGLKIFKHAKLIQGLFRRVAGEIINRYKDVLVQGESPFKIYVIKHA